MLDTQQNTRCYFITFTNNTAYC